MRTLFLLFLIFFLQGCASEKKESKIINESEKPIVSETLISEPELKDTITDTKEIENIEITDSIKTTYETKKINEEIGVINNNVEQKNSVDKENTIEKEIKKNRPDHALWNQLTKKYVSGKGKVHYDGFKSEISKVQEYLNHLQLIPPQKDWTKNEKLAYWFNLYNAATIHLVASAYPVSSIKDINNGKPWDKKFIKSGDSIYSLNEIENIIVRPNFNEPRLHVAFNCAAISCPKLLNEAFTPSKLDDQLHQLAQIWINDPTKNKISVDSLEISKIFQWYAADFKKGIIPFINQYSKTKVNSDAKIQYLEYTWALND